MGAGFDTEKVHYNVESKRVLNFLSRAQTICDPMDCSLQGSSVHGILQARILQWVAIPFSRDLPDLEIEPGVFNIAGRLFSTGVLPAYIPSRVSIVLPPTST